MKTRKWNEADLATIVKNSFSIREVIFKLGLVPAGGNYATINRKIKELNLNTSHFTGQGWNTGIRYINIKPAQPLSEILTENSKYTSSYHLRERLIKEGLKLRKCELCKNTIWLNNPIPLELHHKNGNKTDNRIENIQFLCSNCHALTNNYRGANKSAQKEISDVEVG